MSVADQPFATPRVSPTGHNALVQPGVRVDDDLRMETSAASRPVPRPAAGARSAVLLRVASDERLVDHVRAGSEVAFEVVYDRHHRGILGFCRHMLGSAEEAEDALQHTFMAAYRDLLGSEKAIQLRPWLYTIARNRCFSMLRARRERPLGEMDEPATENLSSEVQRRQDLRDLLGDLSGLPDDQRAALVLAELGAVSHDEIAAVLDVPREKVKALVFQARSSLIASRTARDTPCEEIREQLANLRGGSLRRTTLRRHLREGAGRRALRGPATAPSATRSPRGAARSPSRSRCCRRSASRTARWRPPSGPAPPAVAPRRPPRARGRAPWSRAPRPAGAARRWPPRRWSRSRSSAAGPPRASRRPTIPSARSPARRLRRRRRSPRRPPGTAWRVCPAWPAWRRGPARTSRRPPPRRARPTTRATWRTVASPAPVPARAARTARIRAAAAPSAPMGARGPRVAPASRGRSRSSRPMAAARPAP